MTMDRSVRVAEALKEELSDIVHSQLKDPRVGFVSIVSVEVSRDLRHARAYVSVMGDEQAKSDSIAGLTSAMGFIRTELAKRIRLRYVPELKFELDNTIEHGARINKLLGELAKRDREDDK